MGPMDLTGLSHTAVWFIYFAIGLGFGATLELSGFGDSRKLAAQFYLRDVTVLKVMFTGIIVAATLIFTTSAMGLLDFSRVFVNHTYLWPGIVGGLIMGVGFIVGGFCPGTSVVAASTLKLDGLIFVLGVSFGVFMFGETVQYFEGFWNSSYYGRFTVSDWLGIDAGVAVLLVVIMALLMFFGGEIAEQFFGQKKPWSEIRLRPTKSPKLVAAAALVLVVGITAIVGQPTLDDRYDWVAEKSDAQLNDRSVYVHPGEVVELKSNAGLYVTVLDVRPEKDFNLFHLMGARNVSPDEVSTPEFLRSLSSLPDNNVTFVISNDEQTSTDVWKKLKAFAIMNVYIVEGGYNKWLSIYKTDPCVAVPKEAAGEFEPETLHYAFLQAVGERCYAAHPDCACKEYPTDCFMANHPNLHKRPTVRYNPHALKVDYERKVKLKVKSKVKGGCG